MIATIDFETTWSKDYSLSKMSVAEYILDPRFQVIMLGLKPGRDPVETIVGHTAIAARLKEIDWKNTAALAHNLKFDGAILNWIYGVQPRLWLDTLSMAKAVTSWHRVSSSLASLSKFFDLPPKGDEVLKAQGKRLEDFTEEELKYYREYCARDTENCRLIFDKLRTYFFNNDELELIDVISRMFITPQVQLDVEILKTHLATVEAGKAAALGAVEHIAEKSTLASNQRFAKLLEDLGVEVPLKTSPSTGKLIPALSRGDRGFKELCADPDLPEDIQALLTGRQSVKSTIEETRTRKLLTMAGLTRKHWAFVPLKFSGARTHRFSGDDGTNWQNLQRGSTIRKAVIAPPGMRIVHRDASQIEARMTAWMAGCTALLEAFQQGRDVYSEFASIVYETPINRRDHPLERFVGKTSILGLGYGCGWEKFQHMLFIGNGGVSHTIDDPTAQHIVTTYRSTYPEIPALWRDVGGMIGGLMGGGWVLNKYWVPAEVDDQGLFLPSGLCIAYPNLRVRDGEMVYDDVYSTRKIYGAKGVENISQALARIVVTDIILRVRRETGWVPFLTTHDSLDYCVPERDAETMDSYLAEEFGVVPKWAVGTSPFGDLPLASEGGWGRTLFEAEKAVNE